MTRLLSWLGIGLLVGAITWGALAIFDSWRECSGVVVVPEGQR